MNELLGSYKQFADGHPVDSYIPGDSKQRVDLVEYYAETDQDGATAMVSGTEAMTLGKISRRLAMQLKIQGASNFDPFPSERNARAGQEGFFSTIKDGFKTFIENIIKYIRMALDWVVDTVKSVFGFRKSARINQAVNDSLVDMKKEFATSLNGIGFPAGDYSVENFIGRMPENTNRLGQMVLLKNKLASDEETIKGLQEAIPLLQTAITKLTRASEKATHANKTLKRVIGEEYKRLTVRASNPHLAVSPEDSPEANRVLKACMEVNVALDTTGLASEVRAIYEALYAISFSNEELMAGFSTVRKRIQDTLATEAVKLNKTDVSTLLTSIQYLNQRYIEVGKNEIDLSKIDFKALGNIINRDDATKVEMMAKHLNNPALLTAYQETTVNIRNFTQFCFMVSNSLLIVEQQVVNLCNWHNRANQYYYSGLMNDLEGIAKVNTEARLEGHHPRADIAGYPTDKFVFVQGEDAQTLQEKIAAGFKFSVDVNLGGAKTSLQNFAKQTGWGGGK